jgi:methionyl-tRNA formyltransferase
MLMEAGLDTGPVLLERVTAIEPEDTAGSLHDRLAALGAPALLEGLQGLASGSLVPRPQPPEGAIYAAKIAKAEALMDWSRDAGEIERQVRAFNPWPVAETVLDGEQLRIYLARSVEEEGGSANPPGTIIAVPGDSILVQCGRGTLELRQVQRPGRRPVSARDFAHAVQLVGRRLG